MSDEKNRLDTFKKIINVYNEIKIDKLAKLIGFKNSITLEKWILDLPEKYHSILTIKDKNVIINKENMSEMIDELVNEFKKWEWDGVKSQKIIDKLDLSKIQIVEHAKEIGDIKLSSTGEKFLSFLSTHKNVTISQFMKVFELEEITDLDDWLLNIPKNLGVYLNVSNNVLKFESKIPSPKKVELAKNFDEWITKLMNNLTIVDRSKIKNESNRISDILGSGYHNFFKINIIETKEKYVIIQLIGKNQFISKSKYGDTNYTTFDINEEIKEQTPNFQPDIIEKIKKEYIRREMSQRDGEQFYYTSPSGRHISRLIKTTEKDFTAKLKNLLIVVIPTNIICFSVIKPNKKQDILYYFKPNIMCVNCGEMFKPIEWSEWKEKYLSTNNVYVCENCNPTLKKKLDEEKILRMLYESKNKQILSKKFRFKIFSIINLISLLFLGIILVLLPLWALIFLIIMSTLETFLLIKYKKMFNQEKLINAEEHNRRNQVLNNLKRYDGADLEKKKEKKQILLTSELKKVPIPVEKTDLKKRSLKDDCPMCGNKFPDDLKESYNKGKPVFCTYCGEELK